MKSVNVLARVECAHDLCFVDVVGGRGLNQDPMNAGVAIDLFDATEKLRLCDLRRQLKLH